MYIENEFFSEKEESAFDLLMYKNDVNVNNNNEVKTNENKSEAIEKNEKVESSEKKETEFKINEIQNVEFKKNENKKEEIDKKIEENKITENNIKDNSKKVMNKSNKKNKNDNEYTQTFSRNDFKDKPPKVSNLFFYEFNYENTNVFSHLNDSYGKINESKKVPNIFYNHLLNHKENIGNRYVLTSISKRNYEKVLTYLYYAP